MGAVDIEAVRRQAAVGAIRLTRHAEVERMADEIEYSEIMEALVDAELVEDYSDDPRGPSCLLLGFSKRGSLHLVCGFSSEELVVITVYRPSPSDWENDWRTRKGS